MLLNMNSIEQKVIKLWPFCFIFFYIGKSGSDKVVKIVSNAADRSKKCENKVK